VRKFTDYYFFTPPAELLKTHFPANTNGQLSSHTFDLETFYNAPIYFPSYFTNDVKLVKNTKDTFFVSPNKELEFYFDQLPKKPLLYNQVKNSSLLNKVRFKKKKGTGYISKTKLGKHFKDDKFVTLFLQNEVNQKFKIQKERP
jgi:transglutaminase/protease-like cytokinesis protein 3